MPALAFFHEGPQVERDDALAIAEVLSVLADADVDRRDAPGGDRLLRRFRDDLRRALASGRPGAVAVDRELCIDACAHLRDLADRERDRRQLLAAFALEGVEGRLLEALVSDTLSH